MAYKLSIPQEGLEEVAGHREVLAPLLGVKHSNLDKQKGMDEWIFGEFASGRSETECFTFALLCL